MVRCASAWDYSSHQRRRRRGIRPTRANRAMAAGAGTAVAPILMPPARPSAAPQPAVLRRSFENVVPSDPMLLRYQRSRVSSGSPGTEPRVIQYERPPCRTTLSDARLSTAAVVTVVDVVARVPSAVAASGPPPSLASAIHTRARPAPRRLASRETRNPIASIRQNPSPAMVIRVETR